jgi:hypothetical protein
MAHTLRLRIPDDGYEALRHRAEETNRPPEALAADWIASSLSTASLAVPLELFIGRFESTTPDDADEHDGYLGRTPADKMTGENRRDA